MTPEERIQQLENQVQRLTRQVRQLRRWQAEWVDLISKNQGITPEAITALIARYGETPLTKNERGQLYQEAP